MKITRVTSMVMRTVWRDLTIVKVETDVGLTGLVRRAAHTQQEINFNLFTGNWHQPQAVRQPRPE